MSLKKLCCVVLCPMKSKVLRNHALKTLIEFGVVSVFIEDNPIPFGVTHRFTLWGIFGFWYIITTLP